MTPRDTFRLGIGPTAPGTPNFQIQGDGSDLLANLTYGESPATGAGTRLMWVANEASVRGGRVTGVAWDVRGDHSVAFGEDNNVGDIGAGALSGTGNIIVGGSTDSSIGGGAVNVIFASPRAHIGGGINFIVDSDESFIGGGLGNGITGASIRSAIAGGENNVILGGASRGFIGAGQLNAVLSLQGVIGGGQINTINPASDNSFIGAGGSNAIVGSTSGFIGGGTINIVQNSADGGICGGNENIVFNSPRGFLGGGLQNTVQDSDQGVIGGGRTNIVFISPHGTIGGGENNVVQTSPHGKIGGGENNDIIGSAHGTIGGGSLNAIFTSSDGAIGGGSSNAINNIATRSFIGGGFGNNVNASLRSVIGGGNLNNILAAANDSVIAGGDQNQISGGDFAAIPGGQLCEVNADYSHAQGRQAKAEHAGVWIWADSQAADFSSIVADEFPIRAQGGLRMGDGTDGTHVQPASRREFNTLTLDHAPQETSTGTTETVVWEENCNFDDLPAFPAATALSVRLSGIIQRAGAAGTATFNLRVGGTIGAADGTTHATVSTAGAAEVQATNLGASFSNLGGEQLVKLTIDGDAAGVVGRVRGIQVRIG